MITLRIPSLLPRIAATCLWLLFGLAYACASLAIAGFLLQRTAFDPDRSAGAADVVLGELDRENA